MWMVTVLRDDDQARCVRRGAGYDPALAYAADHGAWIITKVLALFVVEASQSA
jgi:hypothetical protein